MKVAQNMRSLLAANKKKQNWPLCSQRTNPCPAEGCRMKSDPKKFLKRRREKEDMFRPLPLACTHAHRRWSRSLYWSKVMSLSWNSSGERHTGKDEENWEVEVICGFQVSASPPFHFIISLIIKWQESFVKVSQRGSKEGWQSYTMTFRGLWSCLEIRYGLRLHIV